MVESLSSSLLAEEDEVEEDDQSEDSIAAGPISIVCTVCRWLLAEVRRWATGKPPTQRNLLMHYLEDSPDAAFRSTMLWLGDFGDYEAIEAVKVLTQKPFSDEGVVHWAQSMVAGPAVKLAFFTNIFMWGKFFLIPFIAVPFCSCDSDGGMASYPLWLLLLLVVTILVPLAIEVACLWYLLPAQVHILRTFSGRTPMFFGRHMSLRMFLVITLLMSAISHLDVVTNSLFLAKVVATHLPACRPDEVSITFREVMRQAHWPFNYLNNVPLALVVFAAWALMFAQLVTGLLSAVPSREHWDTYNWEVNNRASEENRYFLSYVALNGNSTLHQEALFSLAECGRMSSLKFLKWDCMRFCPYGYFKAGHFADRMAMNISIFEGKAFLETAIFLQIQASCVGIARCLDADHKVDFQLMASLVVTVISTMITFVQTSWLVLDQYRAVHHAQVDDEEGERVYEQIREFTASRSEKLRPVRMHTASEIVDSPQSRSRKNLSVAPGRDRARSLPNAYPSGTASFDFPVFSAAFSVPMKSGASQSLSDRHRGKQRRSHCKFARFVLIAVAFLVCMILAALKMMLNSTECLCGWNVSWPLKNGCVNSYKQV
jgi:hypothetical protein